MVLFYTELLIHQCMVGKIIVLMHSEAAELFILRYYDGL